MKTCSNCNISKPFEEFYKNKSKPGGLQSQCKSCVRAQDKKTYNSNKNKIHARQNAYYKKYYIKNKDRLRKNAFEFKKNMTPVANIARKEKNKAYSKKCRKNLYASYIATLIKHSSVLKSSYIPQYLIEAKRQQILILRELKLIKEAA